MKWHRKLCLFARRVAQKRIQERKRGRILYKKVVRIKQMLVMVTISSLMIIPGKSKKLEQYGLDLKNYKTYWIQHPEDGLHIQLYVPETSIHHDYILSHPQIRHLFSFSTVSAETFPNSHSELNYSEEEKEKLEMKWHLLLRNFEYRRINNEFSFLMKKIRYDDTGRKFYHGIHRIHPTNILLQLKLFCLSNIKSHSGNRKLIKIVGYDSRYVIYYHSFWL